MSSSGAHHDFSDPPSPPAIIHLLVPLHPHPSLHLPSPSLLFLTLSTYKLRANIKLFAHKPLIGQTHSASPRCAILRLVAVCLRRPFLKIRHIGKRIIVIIEI